MASKPVFNLLCFAQLVLGGLMFVFGIVDRTSIQVPFSFLMLPIWIGLLVGVAGISGIVVGRRNERQGYVSVNAVSGIRAVNTLCIGLSLLASYHYGWRIAYTVWQLEASREYVFQQSALKPPPSTDTIQGIVSVILILCLAEMFVGAWLALLEKDQMIFGTVPRQDRPFVAYEADQLQMGVPQTAFHPSQLPQQQQQQKLPHYVAVQNPFPASNMVPSNPNMVRTCSNPNIVSSNTNMVSSNTGMVPNNTGMVPSNPNMVRTCSNPNIVSSNTNMVPSNTNMVPSNTNMVPSNTNMVPSNTNMVPSNTNMVPSNTNMPPSNTNMSSQQGPQRLRDQQSDASGATNLQVEGRGAVY